MEGRRYPLAVLIHWESTACLTLLLFLLPSRDLAGKSLVDREEVLDHTFHPFAWLEPIRSFFWVGVPTVIEFVIHRADFAGGPLPSLPLLVIIVGSVAFSSSTSYSMV